MQAVVTGLVGRYKVHRSQQQMKQGSDQNVTNTGKLEIRKLQNTHFWLPPCHIEVAVVRPAEASRTVLLLLMRLIVSSAPSLT